MFWKAKSQFAKDAPRSVQQAGKLAEAKIQRDKIVAQRDAARERNSLLQSRVRFLEPLAMAGWQKFASYDAYWEDQRLHAPVYAAHRAYEKALWANRATFFVPGKCGACQMETFFEVDSVWAAADGPAWRERGVCRACGLNTRLRAAFQFLLNVVPPESRPRIYATEQVTAFFNLLKKSYPNAIGSEFLSDGTERGQVSAQGIRHEDLTALTFEDNSLDAIATFEVLEHVSDSEAAIRECARVLKPGGLFWASFPFDISSRSKLVRATVDASGEITHHLPPEYHGDPINAKGCLCYQYFGWDVLDSLRSAGMVHLDVYSVWNPALNLIGPGLHFIAGRKAF